VQIVLRLNVCCTRTSQLHLPTTMTNTNLLSKLLARCRTRIYPRHLPF
jgi:hypothetical protein